MFRVSLFVFRCSSCRVVLVSCSGFRCFVFRVFHCPVVRFPFFVVRIVVGPFFVVRVLSMRVCSCFLCGACVSCFPCVEYACVCFVFVVCSCFRAFQYFACVSCVVHVV